jgi:Rps23 Pro-64 3,4-dihydroxylase Tpa1-like proline 4-hydroxylase
LNLLIYLNPQWQADWGGNLELHSNPRQPEENKIKSFVPIFNRCLIFETNEYSWHGFSQINLPENQRHLSRKSLSIYLYTKERPSPRNYHHRIQLFTSRARCQKIFNPIKF